MVVRPIFGSRELLSLGYYTPVSRKRNRKKYEFFDNDMIFFAEALGGAAEVHAEQCLAPRRVRAATGALDADDAVPPGGRG